MKRPTMADIARHAGVTKAAVSFALNGLPGVSEETRARILRIAQDIGWQPNSAARALSDGRAGAFGLVVDRPARMLGVEPWFMQLISGIQAELSAAATSLLFTVAEDRHAEIELYRAWWAQRRVDGVILVDLRDDDPRVPELVALGLPTVVIGAAAGAGPLVSVYFDDAEATRTVVRYLAELGHRRVAHVTGLPGLLHTRIRDEQFRASASAAGLECVSVRGDYTGERGAQATTELLSTERPPTAILYDNDLMAIAGLSAAQRLGVTVPDELSLVAWDDSALCELVHPALTALHRDIAAYGAHAARALLAITAGGTASSVCQEVPTLTIRGSAAPPQRPER